MVCKKCGKVFDSEYGRRSCHTCAPSRVPSTDPLGISGYLRDLELKLAWMDDKGFIDFRPKVVIEEATRRYPPEPDWEEAMMHPRPCVSCKEQFTPKGRGQARRTTCDSCAPKCWGCGHALPRTGAGATTCRKCGRPQDETFLRKAEASGILVDERVARIKEARVAAAKEAKRVLAEAFRKVAEILER